MVTPMPPIVAKRQHISPARAGFSRCKCDHTAASARFSPHPPDYRLQAPPIEDHTRRCTRFRRVPRPLHQRRQSPPATPASSVSPTIGRRLYHQRPLPLREQRSTPTTDAVSLSLPQHTQGSTTGNAPAHPKAHAFPAHTGFHLVKKTGFVSRLSLPHTRRFPPPAPSLDEVIDELFPAQAEFHPWRRANRTPRRQLAPHTQSSTTANRVSAEVVDAVPARAEFHQESSFFWNGLLSPHPQGFPRFPRFPFRTYRKPATPGISPHKQGFHPYPRTLRTPLPKLGPTPALAGTSTRLANHAQPFRRDTPR